jgi:GH24 family phage-related lysozyme (muramidase)
MDEKKRNSSNNKMAVSSSGNPKKGGALVPIGIRGTDLVSENIDERILRLLGIEDVFDLDYDTYISLLKERLVTARMSGGKIPTEEDVLLQNEFKRVKGNVGRFKVRPTKITADSFKTKPTIVKQKKLLIGKSNNLESANIQKGIFAGILTSLDDILKSLTEQNKVAKKESESNRKKEENEKRSIFESGLEKRFQKVAEVAQKLLSPVKSILDRIIDFFVTVFIGNAVYKLVDWIANPENKRKIDSILKFLKDYWPALLSAYFLFGTTLGGFVRSISGILIRGIASLAVKNPIATTAVIGGVGAAVREGQIAEQRKELKTLTPEKAKETGKTPPPSQLIGEQGSRFGLGQAFRGGGLANRIAKFAGGGFTGQGMVEGEKGIDKIPAMLSDGEFVMSRGAVQKWGLSTLESMNAAGGGTNKPRILNGVQHAAGGGAIGTASELIKKEEALSSVTPGTNDYIIPGGKSVVSGMSWSKIKPQTILHAYLDSKNIPTIGWGATYYDGITNGTKKVRMGDKITKRKADMILSSNVGQLANKYKKEILHWSKMSPQQQAAILSIGYNAGANAPTGGYPKLSAAIESGNMLEASKHVHRSGPSRERLEGERKLLLTGPIKLDKVRPNTSPKNIKTVSPPTPSKNPGFLQKLGTTFGSIFGNQSSAIDSKNLEMASAQINRSGMNITPPIVGQPKIITIETPVEESSPPTNPSSQSVPSINAVHSDGYSRTAQILGVV